MRTIVYSFLLIFSLSQPENSGGCHLYGKIKFVEYGEDYKYPHSYEKSFVNENYFPKDQSFIFYKPTDNGYEKYIKERLKNLWSERYE